jgi:hypothetical protein
MNRRKTKEHTLLKSKLFLGIMTFSISPAYLKVQFFNIKTVFKFSNHLGKAKDELNMNLVDLNIFNTNL